MVRMKRVVPVRAGLIVLAVLFVAFNSLCNLFGAVAASDAVAMTLLTLIGTAVGLDTVRPSGVIRGTEAGAASVAGDVKSTLEKLAAAAAKRREERGAGERNGKVPAPREPGDGE